MTERALKLGDAFQLYQDHYNIDEAGTLKQERLSRRRGLDRIDGAQGLTTAHAGQLCLMPDSAC